MPMTKKWIASFKIDCCVFSVNFILWVNISIFIRWKVYKLSNSDSLRHNVVKIFLVYSILHNEKALTGPSNYGNNADRNENNVD